MNEKELPKGASRSPGAPRPPSSKPTATPLMSQKWFVPAVLGALVVLAIGVVLLSKSSDKKAAAAPPDPQKTGRVVVKSNRADATVEATRNPAAAGAAGFTGVVGQPLSGLPPGKYTVTARSDGWPDVRGEVTIEAAQTAGLTLNFKSGSLHLDSDPPGATVRRGDAVLGTTPLDLPQLPPGECQLTLEYPAWPALAFKTVITENVGATETVRLPHGKLVVETSPPGATVRLDGRTIGQTPLTVERIPAGAKKLTLSAKDFPTLVVSGTVEDRGELKVNVPLATGFPELDPAVLLRSVWVPDNLDKLAPQFDTAGPYQPLNGVVKNLQRKKLYENWLRKSYRFSGTVKAYEPGTGQIEFAEQTSELSKYRVLAKLSPEARAGKDLAAQVAKGATFEIYGRLTAVEEPHWPLKVITLEISSAEQLHPSP